MEKKDNNNMNEDPVIITLDDKQFRASELNDDQKVLAAELHGIADEMRQLEARFNKLNRDKNYRILDFQNSLNATEEVEVVEADEEK
jgi:hypothetical protein